MTLTIDINDNVADKILYFLENFKNDVKIIKQHPINNDLDIEPLSKDELDYQIIVKAREERSKYPQNYIAEDDIEL